MVSENPQVIAGAEESLLPIGKLRMKFYKKGKLKFISHLDLVRTLKGALLRAKIPIYYTEGFNPHPKMVFALPLPLGEESVCEYLDIRLTEAREREALLSAVNAQLTADMRFTEAYLPERSFQEITAARYEMRFREITAEALEKALSGSLPVMKKSKKGMVEVDLKPHILSVSLQEEPLPEGGIEIVADALLASSESSFVSPENLVKALRTATGASLEDYDVLRREVYAGEEIFR